MNTKRGEVAFSGEKRWLSNMWETLIIFEGNKNNLQKIFPQFKFDGLEYGSAEHLYQSLKATNDEDKELIRTAPTPDASKRVGRKVFSRMDWDSVKVEAMRLTLYLKFYQNPELLLKLVETGNEELVEVNWWHDTFWGVDCHTGDGENWLGRLLMELRTHSKLLLVLDID